MKFRMIVFFLSFVVVVTGCPRGDEMNHLQVKSHDEVAKFKPYKEVKASVQLDGESAIKVDEIRLKANKNKAPESFKNVESMQGIVPESKLDNAHYKLKKLMTYEESFNQGYTDQLIFEIDGDRMVYVVQVKSNKDINFDGRLVKCPLITTIYDAETGETICFMWKAEA
ncbi:hypothetical protein [Paenibacillus montanisoli]|uniref:Lipoprotein n=1 Tax=Paenibacillus montanisoli TaxID=2081970 RepID=A0A328U091_9BACL|nr:hypothetical protein [Paenibacillus montanisoli]RAP76099.1 hypothetical protein DL346_11800 [Paenibacillus montanisoli]